MVRHAKETPRFDARFGDYGFDKISYVEELRERGFKMYVLRRAFAIDYPHPMWASEGGARRRSTFKKKYIEDFESNAMRREFWKFLEELDAKWGKAKHFPICKKLQRQYYDRVEDDEEKSRENELEWKVKGKE